MQDAQAQKLQGNVKEAEMRKEELEAQIRVEEEQQAAMGEQLRSRQAKIEATEAQDADLRARVLKLDESVKYAQSSSQETEGRVAALNSDIRRLQDEIAATKREGESAKRELNDELVSVAELEGTVSEMQGGLAAKEDELLSTKEEIRRSTAEHDALLDEHYKNNEEYTALKEHAGVVEMQNREVFSLLHGTR